ncbi:MAG: PASTA domain-containing protein [Alistipes sp.]|nr:PASTA domain-containing protein [Alistipes sp.]
MAKKSNKESWLSKLRSKPIVWNAVLIVLMFLILFVVSYIGLGVATRHGMRLTVPDFTALSLDDARYFAKQKGLKIVVNDSLYVPAYPGGMVLDQLPKGGVTVKGGRKIYLTINSFAQKKLPLPYVAGRSLRQAKNMLESAGFGIERLEYVEDIATNYVLEQYLGDEMVTAESDIRVEKGTGVILKVGISDSQTTTTVPRLIGRALFDAKGRLWEQGLNVGKVTYDEGINLLNQNDARVVRQSILHGTVSSLGSAVSIHLTLDHNAVAAAAEQADKAAEEALAARNLADSLAAVAAADSLRMLESVEPQHSQADDEFFF